MILFFSSDSDLLICPFVVDMKAEFQMSILGEISYFLGLQITRIPKGFLSHKVNISRD